MPVGGYMQAMVSPLTPPPKGLALASKSSPWSTIWRMLGIVVLLYIIADLMVYSLFGIVWGDPSTTFISLICSVPLLLIPVADSMKIRSGIDY